MKGSKIGLLFLNDSVKDMQQVEVEKLQNKDENHVSGKS